MPHASISIKQSRADQGDLRGHREHASVLPDLLPTLGSNHDGRLNAVDLEAYGIASNMAVVPFEIHH